MQPITQNAWSKPPCPGWGTCEQGSAIPSIFFPRVLWVPLNVLVPEWLPDGVLDPPGMGLGAHSWAQLAPGSITDASSAWFSMGQREVDREQAEEYNGAST